jgi:GntR family negative regulator for fad regulon and positive regulator of fabA
LRPAEHAERALVGRILDGTYPVGSALPGERALAAALGVTRPTVREALQRLSRDGWVVIRQGTPTRVRDYLREGGLGVLAALSERAGEADGELVAYLLEVRGVLAPAYVRAAARLDPEGVLAALDGSDKLAEEPAEFAAFDWALHRDLARASGNPIYALILNDFEGISLAAGRGYFESPAARAASREFYAALRAAVREGPEAAAEVTRRAMLQSCALWRKAGGGRP